MPCRQGTCFIDSIDKLRSNRWVDYHRCCWCVSLSGARSLWQSRQHHLVQWTASGSHLWYQSVPAELSAAPAGRALARWQSLRGRTCISHCTVQEKERRSSFVWAEVGLQQCARLVPCHHRALLRVCQTVIWCHTAASKRIKCDDIDLDRCLSMYR